MPTISKKQPSRPWMPERKAFGRMRVDNGKLYRSKRWMQLRDAFRSQNPLCVNYEKCGGATHTIDHVKPISEGGAIYDWANLQALCVSCNASKTGKQAWAKSNHE